MADVKWIKITTNVFDDEKIRVIETMPEGDTIIVIWFKLLCLAGKSNENGYIMMNEEVAYTEDMLVALFNRPILTVQLALKTFKQFKMIEVIDNILCLPNWEKHQNIEGLDKIRIQNKDRQKKHRDKLKNLRIENKEEDIDKELDIERVRDSSVTVTLRKVVDYLNIKLSANYHSTSSKTQNLIKARLNEGFAYDDFVIVIDKKYNEWHNTDMAKFLRPETLFSNKFEGYLNQLATSTNGKPKNAFQSINEKLKQLEDHSE